MKLTTTLEDVQAAASRCLRDGRCTYGSWPDNHILCPIYRHDPSFTFSGGGYLFLILALLDNKIDFDQSTADFAFSCAGCMACDSNCSLIRCHAPYVGILDIIRLLRSDAVKRGFVPEGIARNIYEEVKKRGDYGQVTEPGPPSDFWKRLGTRFPGSAKRGAAAQPYMTSAYGMSWNRWSGTTGKG